MSTQFISSELLEEDPGLIDLVDKFISRLPILRDDIFKMYSENDIEAFSKLIHQMKGVGGNYGYPMLSELCAAIEVSCEEEFSQVQAQLDELKVITEKILAGSEENHKIATAIS